MAKKRPLPRVFIAAPWLNRLEADAFANSLASHCTIVSTWHAPGEPFSDPEAAAVDLSDLAKADALVLMTPPNAVCSTTGGKHFETGVAFAHGIEVAIYGEPENIYHTMKLVTVCRSRGELETFLKQVTPRAQPHKLTGDMVLEDCLAQIQEWFDSAFVMGVNGSGEARDDVKSRSAGSRFQVDGALRSVLSDYEFEELTVDDE